MGIYHVIIISKVLEQNYFMDVLLGRIGQEYTFYDQDLVIDGYLQILITHKYQT